MNDDFEKELKILAEEIYKLQFLVADLEKVVLCGFSNVSPDFRPSVSKNPDGDVYLHSKADIHHMKIDEENMPIKGVF